MSAPDLARRPGATWPLVLVFGVGWALVQAAAWYFAIYLGVSQRADWRSTVLFLVPWIAAASGVAIARLRPRRAFAVVLVAGLVAAAVEVVMVSAVFGATTSAGWNVRLLTIAVALQLAWLPFALLGAAWQRRRRNAA